MRWLVSHTKCLVLHFDAAVINRMKNSTPPLFIASHKSTSQSGILFTLMVTRKFATAWFTIWLSLLQNFPFTNWSRWRELPSRQIDYFKFVTAQPSLPYHERSNHLKLRLLETRRLVSDEIMLHKLIKMFDLGSGKIDHAQGDSSNFVDFEKLKTFKTT